MEIIMGKRGARFVGFLKLKLRERKGSIDGYNDADYARDLKIEYHTVKRWLSAKNVERIDIENYMAVEDVFGQEFRDYMRG